MNCPVFLDIWFIVAILPLFDPLILWPATKSNAPGWSSTIFINSSVDSDIDNSTGVNESPINADIFSPTTKLNIFCVTEKTG